jgi:hypothetical protein
MRNHRFPPESIDLVSRLRRLLSTALADSQDIAEFDGAIARFQSLELRRKKRQSLSSAREHKDSIIARLAFLAELDELTERETDITVFEEVASIFDEIALAAVAAASDVRAIAGEDTKH